MQHPDFTQQLAGDRQARDRAQAARSRVTRPDRSGDRRAAGPDGSGVTPMNESNSAVGGEIRTPSLAASSSYKSISSSLS